MRAPGVRSNLAGFFSFFLVCGSCIRLLRLLLLAPHSVSCCCFYCAVGGFAPARSRSVIGDQSFDDGSHPLFGGSLTVRRWGKYNGDLGWVQPRWWRHRPRRNRLHGAVVLRRPLLPVVCLSASSVASQGVGGDNDDDVGLAKDPKTTEGRKPPMMMNMATADNNTGRGAGLPLLVPAVRVHHAALQTPNITRSIQFYGLFGFEEVCRFRAGPARAVWLDLLPAVNAGGTTADPPPCCRLELIEVPAHLFLPPGSSGVNSQSQDSPLPPPPPRALNVMGHPSYLGYHHLALDVTGQMLHESDDLASWIDRVNETSVATFGKSIRVALRPRQQLIGRSVYELAFLYDDTGCLVELLNHVADLNQPVASGWEPWDGRGFVGPSDSSSTAEYR